MTTNKQRVEHDADMTGADGCAPVAIHQTPTSGEVLSLTTTRKKFGELFKFTAATGTYVMVDFSAAGIEHNGYVERKPIAKVARVKPGFFEAYKFKCDALSRIRVSLPVKKMMCTDGIKGPRSVATDAALVALSVKWTEKQCYPGSDDTETPSESKKRRKFERRTFGAIGWVEVLLRVDGHEQESYYCDVHDSSQSMELKDSGSVVSSVASDALVEALKRLVGANAETVRVGTGTNCVHLVYVRGGGGRHHHTLVVRGEGVAADTPVVDYAAREFSVSALKAHVLNLLPRDGQVGVSILTPGSPKSPMKFEFGCATAEYFIVVSPVADDPIECDSGTECTEIDCRSEGSDGDEMS